VPVITEPIKLTMEPVKLATRHSTYG